MCKKIRFFISAIRHKIKMGRKKHNKGIKALPGLIQYKFDIYLSKGILSQSVMLIVFIAILILVFGLITGIISSHNVGMSLWQSFLHIIDPGTIGGDDTDDMFYIVLMCIATLMGMAFTGTIVGIINNAIEGRLNELNKGHSRVIEKNHILIIGFDENVYTILDEIEESNKNYEGKGDPCVIVVDKIPKDEMEHDVKENKWAHKSNTDIKNEFKKGEKRTNIIYRSGDVISENTFSICAAEDASAIIINRDDDFDTIRILLALVSYLKSHNRYIDDDDMPSIVALMHKYENISAAAIAAGVKHDEESDESYKNEYKIRILYFESIIARLFAQVCKQPGLSWVMSELLNYEGAEFYIEDKYRDINNSLASIEDKFIGKNIYEIADEISNAVPVGFAKEDANSEESVILNPGPDVRFEKGMKLVHLAEDDNSLDLYISSSKEDNSRAVAQGVVLKNNDADCKGDKEVHHFLILGWSIPLPGLVRNVEEYCLGGSSITIISKYETGAGLTHMNTGVALNVIKANPYDWEELSSVLNNHDYWFNPKHENHLTNIVIMCNDGIENEEADEKATVLLLNVREYMRVLNNEYVKKNRALCGDEGDTGNDIIEMINITTEMNLPQDQKLLQNMSTNDFIVGSEIANRLMVQVAENPQIYYIFANLLKEQGEVIALRKFTDYVDTSVPFNYECLAQAVINRSIAGDSEYAIPMGWIRLGYEENMGISGIIDPPVLTLNPDIAERNRIFEGDNYNPQDPYGRYRLVLIAKGNSESVKIREDIVRSDYSFVDNR